MKPTGQILLIERLQRLWRELDWYKDNYLNLTNEDASHKVLQSINLDIIAGKAEYYDEHCVPDILTGKK